MKIAVDARTMGSCPSGIGIYLYDFVKEMASSNVFNLLLITDVAESEQILFLKHLGVPVVCFGRKVFRSACVYSYFRFVKKTLCEQQPELFWEPNNLLPVRLDGFYGKTVLTIHDLFPITKPEYFEGLYRLYFKIGIRKSLKQADAVLFNSAETQRLAQQHFPNIKEKLNFVAYLIVKMPPARTISDDGFFLYIGNLERRKGTDLLLKAYRAYRIAGGKKPLYLGGNIREDKIGKLLKAIQKDFHDVNYLGYLDEEKKCDLLSKCSCFLFPSKAEGFGIPPLEALGYRKPVITSNLSIFNEILKFPVKTFELEATEDEQICQLCHLMLNSEQIVPPPKHICSEIFDYYRSDVLGKKMILFFKSVGSETVEETDENCF